jgi:hypothetical protein
MDPNETCPIDGTAGDAEAAEVLEKLNGQARPTTGEILGNYSRIDILQWAESVTHDWKTAIRIGSMGHEVCFVETIQTELLGRQVRVRSLPDFALQTQEVISAGGLEVKR